MTSKHILGAQDGLNSYFQGCFRFKKCFTRVVLIFKRIVLLFSKTVPNYDDLLLDSYKEFIQTSQQLNLVTTFHHVPVKLFQYHIKRYLFADNGGSMVYTIRTLFLNEMGPCDSGKLLLLPSRRSAAVYHVCPLHMFIAVLCSQPTVVS